MPRSEYLDCELYLTAYDQGKLSVAGQDYYGRPHLDDDLKRRLLEAALDPIQYGTFLFEALLPKGDDLLAGYREALAVARSQEKRLRFRMHVAPTAPSALHDLHWEILFDPKRKYALGRSRNTAFSRYLGVDAAPPGPCTERPRILVVIPTPQNLAAYDLAEIDAAATKQTLRRGLQALDFEFLEGPSTLRRVVDRVLAGEFDGLHIHTHGVRRQSMSGASLILEAEDGACAFIEERDFAEIFEGELKLRLIVLVACSSGARTRDDPFSGLAATLVKRGIPAVLAMRRPISFEAADILSQELYRHLARSGIVDQAVNHTRLQLHSTKPDAFEWSTPILFTRLSDGRLWKAAQPIPVPPPRNSVPWRALLTRIKAGRFIPILGPGIHRGLLPSHGEIATRWANEYRYPLDGLSRRSLALVAQYVEAEEGRHYPHDILPKLLIEELLERQQLEARNELKDLPLGEVIDRLAMHYFGRDAEEPHRILAELPISTYITTNYDSLMLAALRWVGKKPRSAYCLWQRDLEDESSIDSFRQLRGSEEEPLIFHLYGNEQAPALQVLTEDDYLDFLGEISESYEECVPYKLRSSLSNSMLLFLGYKVGSIDCRVLFRGLVRKLKNLRRGRVAFLQPPPERMFTSSDEMIGRLDRSSELQHFIERGCGDLDIGVYWGSDRDFLVELRDRWRTEC